MFWDFKPWNGPIGPNILTILNQYLKQEKKSNKINIFLPDWENPKKFPSKKVNLAGFFGFWDFSSWNGPVGPNVLIVLNQ